MLSPRANQIPELIQCLGNRSSSAVDTARARLAIFGSRAVGLLIAALEDDNDRIRERVMPLLALIQDPRAREPLVAMLRDRNVRLREVAARSLGRFPSRESGHSLCRLLTRDRSLRVKTAAVQALLEHYAAGQEQSMAPLLERLTDPAVATPLRVATVPLLSLLQSAERQGLLEQLSQDPDPTVRAAAERVEQDRRSADQRRPARIRAWIELLDSKDYAVWQRAVQKLSACGHAAVDPLLGEMQGRAHDPEFCTRAGMVLKGMGPRRCPALAEALFRFDEPLPLQVLVDVIGAIGEKSMVYRLKDLIDQIAARPTHRGHLDGFDLMQRVRAQAHLELARIGSRLAIRDLRETLVDSDTRLEAEIIAALTLIGKSEELPGLLQAHAREDADTRRKIGEALRTIMKRERIRRNHPMFRELSEKQRRVLESILPPRPGGSSPRKRTGIRGAGQGRG